MEKHEECVYNNFYRRHRWPLELLSQFEKAHKASTSFVERHWIQVKMLLSDWLDGYALGNNNSVPFPTQDFSHITTTLPIFKT